jgi:hypothetical protein
MARRAAAMRKQAERFVPVKIARDVYRKVVIICQARGVFIADYVTAKVSEGLDADFKAAVADLLIEFGLDSQTALEQLLQDRKKKHDTRKTGP